MAWQLLRTHQDRFVLDHHGDTGDSGEMSGMQGAEQGVRNAGSTALGCDDDVCIKGRFSPVCVEKFLPGACNYRRQNRLSGLHAFEATNDSRRCPQKGATPG